ncbi:MAG: radical SAM protein [Deltaproteobacteria bacterium]|nr:radical SAM protein [Deltaproteobacteria bacterium]
MKVLLLSPPGRHQYVRDYYCSKIAKADYSYSPVDLLLLSGRFPQSVFIDAIQQHLNVEACLNRIKQEAPQAIISLVASVSWPEDRSFLAKVKADLPSVPILATGDVLLEDGQRLLQQEKWLDAIILDFTNADAVKFLAGDFDHLEQMIFRTVDGRISTCIAPRRPGPITDLPQPRHELFLNQHYAYPFVRHRRFATVQTDYGCPFPCRFCVMGSLSHRVRPKEEVIKELRDLRQRGIREIYFNDQTFGGTKRRLTDLCQAFLDSNLSLGWCCWNRVDLVADQLELMKRAGCHTIMFGVDAGDEETLKLYRKGYTIDQVRRTFDRCRRLGIRTLGTFILGLPSQDGQAIKQVIDLALELDPDFVSFNVYVPRKGTSVRAELADDLPDEETVLDQSGAMVKVSKCGISPEELKTWRDQAVRSFYLRPGYVWRRLAGIRSFYDLEVLIRTAWSMIWG